MSDAATAHQQDSADMNTAPPSTSYFIGWDVGAWICGPKDRFGVRVE